jgi:hypothetical protein
MEPEDSFTVRVGMFLLVVGAGAFLLFVVSDIAEKTDFDYLFTAMVLIGIGWGMWRKKPAPPSAGRFEYLRRLRENRGKKREDKQKGNQEKK